MTLTIRPITPADYPMLVAIYQGEANAPTVEQLEQADRSLPPDMLLHRVGAFAGERLVGLGRASAEPTRRPGCFDLLIRVLPDWQRQGIGTKLYQELERYAVARGATLLDGYTKDEPGAGQHFAERLGFQLRQHIFESKLDLSAFDPTEYQDGLARLEASGIRLTTFAAFPQDDAALDRLRAFYTALHRDVPGTESMAEPSLDQFKQRTIHAVGWEPQQVHLAVEGDRWAGLSFVCPLPDGTFVNDLTAVHPEYRGRGVATAVKVKALAYAQAKGGSWIRTHNDASNRPMLAVNRKLGYRPEPGIFRFSKPVEKGADHRHV